VSGFRTGVDVAKELKAPEKSKGEDVKQLVEQAGWEVEAVDWAFKHVTGESIVEKVIKPITGDFDKIAMNGQAWRNIANSMSAFSQEFHSNVQIVRKDWDGNAAVQHETFVQAGWVAGLFAEGKVAQLIAKGFDMVAEMSKKLCAKALNLLKTLVDKLLEAVAEIWVPAAGWVAAATKIWDAYQLFQQIMQIIEMVKDLVNRAKDLWHCVQDIGSQLAKIKDCKNIDDVMGVAGNIGKDVGKASDDVQGIAGDAKGIGQGTMEAKEGLKKSWHDRKTFPGDVKQGWHETKANKDEMVDRAHQVGKNTMHDLKNAPGAAWDHAKSSAQQHYNGAKSAVHDGINSVKDGSALHAAKQAATDHVKDAAQNAYQENVGKYVDAAKAAPGAIHQAASDGVQQARDGVQQVKDGVHAVQQAPGQIAQATHEGWQTVKDGAHAGAEAAKQVPGAVAEGWNHLRNANPKSLLTKSGDLND
jgi:X-X-X-Leu-X-X-Gly heptad repeat protein